MARQVPSGLVPARFTVRERLRRSAAVGWIWICGRPPPQLCRPVALSFEIVIETGGRSPSYRKGDTTLPASPAHRLRRAEHPRCRNSVRNTEAYASTTRASALAHVLFLETPVT